MKIKIICGFDEDQKFSVDAEEAHKAYYLWLNPNKRGIFSNGLPIIGKDIQRIVPDYNGTMGWNPSHELQGEDWNEIRSKGLDVTLRELLNEAKTLAHTLPPEKMNIPLSQLRTQAIGTRTLMDDILGDGKL